jgi:[NiFe] hydrogenase diaphorase moiety large subunit
VDSNQLKRVDIIFSPYSSYPYENFEMMLKKDRNVIVQELIDSGLKGRGGAGFLTGMKWKFAKDAPGDEKYIICNADEGEPGTFKDREILTKVPRKVLSGMGICAHVIGAQKGFIYLRAEYNFLKPQLEKDIELFNEKAKSLGLNFRISIFSGAGAYVCGEETALIESMEGKRGEPRNKPPYPVINGYLDKPTVINNVETFVSTMMVCRIGAEEYAKFGIQGQKGSKLYSVSGDTPNGGVYELELGLTVQDIVNEFGDGDTKAVQVGGVSGYCVPRKDFKTRTIGFPSTITKDAIPTGGSIMLFNSKRSMYRVLQNYLEFFCEESCGQCTPCRVGTQQLLKGIEAVKSKQKPASYLDTLIKLSDTMHMSSKCGLGQSVANSFKSIASEYKEEIIY